MADEDREVVHAADDVRLETPEGYRVRVYPLCGKSALFPLLSYAPERVNCPECRSAGKAGKK